MPKNSPRIGLHGETEAESLKREIDDLREQLVAETALRRQYETQLKQLSASLPITIWMSDPQNELTFVSDNWYDLSGIGIDALGAWSKSIHPDERRRVLTYLGEVVRQRSRVEVEYRALKADRQTAWVLMVGAPRFSDEGRYDGYVGAIFDVSERKAAVDALQQAEARLSLALEGTRVGVWDWDIASGEVWMSDSALEIQGFSRGDVHTHVDGFEPYIHPDDWHAYQRLLRDCLKGEAPLIHAENRLRCKDGSWVWVSERARVVERDAIGRAVRMMGTRTDLTERHARDERIRWLAAHDVLTELPNRARFQEMLLAAMHEADARGTSMGLLLLDIDRFKEVNDQFGHDAGDALLRRVAKRLRMTFPKPAALARLGGDEFAAIIKDVRSAKDLLQHAERAVWADIVDGNVKRDSTASVGAAIYPLHAANSTDLIKRADIALYKAKDNGRACAVLYAD